MMNKTTRMLVINTSTSVLANIVLIGFTCLYIKSALLAVNAPIDLLTIFLKRLKAVKFSAKNTAKSKFSACLPKIKTFTKTKSEIWIKGSKKVQNRPMRFTLKRIFNSLIKSAFWTAVKIDNELLLRKNITFFPK